MLHDTPTGRRLSRRYLEAAGIRVTTVDLAMAEISAKLARAGRTDFITEALGGMEEMSEVIAISREVAEVAGPLLLQLRRVDPQASVADAIMLSAARSRDAMLVSNDSCYHGLRDVAGA